MKENNVNKSNMLVSVIVPIYNAGDYLKRCLNSILEQSYECMEIVLVNDGSTDNSLDIIELYAKQDGRILILNQENCGVAAARNAGIRNMSGDVFLFVDSDDWIECNMVEKMVKLLDENTDIVFCGFDNAETVNEVKKVEKVLCEEWNQEEQQYQFMLHKRMTGMLWNKLIRASLIENISFDEKIGYGEDAQFLWQVLKKSKRMIITNEILYHHILEKSSISHQSFNDRKFSAIVMWEKIVEEVQRVYPDLAVLAKERLVSAAVYSCYEVRRCCYDDQDKISYMRAIVRRHLLPFLKSFNISLKMKLYAIYISVGL